MAKDNYLSSVEEARDQLICTGYPQKLYLYLLSGPEPLFTIFALTLCRSGKERFAAVDQS